MAPMVFFPLGGVPQLRLASADDLAQIGELDRARWGATSMPIDQMFCDPRVLAHLDADHNGRVRVDEILEAQRWLWAHLSGRDGVTEKRDVLRLTDVDTSTTAGARMRALAERLLGQLGAADRSAISLAQVVQFREGYARTFPNGDGVVTPAQISDPALAALAAEVIAGTGGAPDLGGDAGIRAADVDAWVARCEALRAWRAQAVAPLGDATAAGVAAVQAIAPKVAQFFAQCALVSAEAQAGARLQATPEELAALDVRDPAAIEGWLDAAPLARPDASGALDRGGPINPRYRAALDAALDAVGPAALGGPVTRLDQAGWAAILAFIQPYVAWQAARPADIDAAMPDDRLDAAAAGADALRALAAQDQSVADELQEFTNLERAVLYQRWLLDIANNFVSFEDLFNPDTRSLLEAGTLILDGRRLNLCTAVADIAAHKAIASQSRVFIAYVRTTRRDGAADVTGQFAAAVTAGTRGGIAVGKRGVFYDRDGREADALIVDLVEQPISVWESMIEPVERLRTFIADKITQLAAKEQGSLAAATTGAADKATAAPPPPPDPKEAPGSNLQSLMMGGGIAIAAIGSSLAFVVQTLSQIDPVGLVFGLGTLLAGLMLVSGFLGWLKLRRRDLSTLLEASGWALNGRMYLTFAMGAVFTREPDLPAGSRVQWTPGQLRNRVLLALTVLAALALGAWLVAHPEALASLQPEPPAAPAEPPAEPPAG